MSWIHFPSDVQTFKKFGAEIHLVPTYAITFLCQKDISFLQRAETTTKRGVEIRETRDFTREVHVPFICAAMAGIPVYQCHGCEEYGMVEGMTCFPLNELLMGRVWPSCYTSYVRVRIRGASFSRCMHLIFELRV